MSNLRLTLCRDRHDLKIHHKAHREDADSRRSIQGKSIGLLLLSNRR
jgi:hypothetical protein